MDGRVAQMDCRYRIEGDPVCAAGLAARLDRLATDGRLGAALADALDRRLDTSGGHWVLRRLDTRVSLDIAGTTTDQALAAAWAEQIAVAVQRGLAGGGVEARRYDGPAEHAAAWIRHSLDGGAPGRWWFRAFAGFETAPLPRRLASALEAQGAALPGILADLARDGALARLLTLLPAGAAERLWTRHLGGPPPGPSLPRFPPELMAAGRPASLAEILAGILGDDAAELLPATEAGTTADWLPLAGALEEALAPPLDGTGDDTGASAGDDTGASAGDDTGAERLAAILAGLSARGTMPAGELIAALFGGGNERPAHEADGHRALFAAALSLADRHGWWRPPAESAAQAEGAVPDQSAVPAESAAPGQSAAPDDREGLFRRFLAAHPDSPDWCDPAALADGVLDALALLARHHLLRRPEAAPGVAEAPGPDLDWIDGERFAAGLARALDPAAERPARPATARQTALLEAIAAAAADETTAITGAPAPLRAHLIARAETETVPTLFGCVGAMDLTGRFRRRPLLRVDLPAPSFPERRELWRQALGKSGVADAATAAMAAALANGFHLAAGPIADAVADARTHAAERGGDDAKPLASELAEACRRRSSPGLARLARRIDPKPGLDFSDLVLPPACHRQIQYLRRRVRLRGHVQDERSFGHRLAVGRGLIALFTGTSGTGKTMTAQLLALDVGVSLYKVDLSAVVSKYVGETEKNLERVFAESEDANAILFFDEADALFGKRGDVKEARDRWANLEVNYLLQRNRSLSPC